MESKIMVTIPCQFSSSWSSNKCHVCLLTKSIVWFFPPGGLSKVPNSPKFPASLAMGFLEKKKHAADCLCPRGLRGCDSSCPRRELSDIDGSACARRPHTVTHIPYTLYTRIHIQQWRRAVLLGSLLQTTRKVKRKWRKSRACCFVWENVPFWNCRLFTTSCFDFSTMFESCWSKNCTNLLSSIHDQSARARPLAWFNLQNATSKL